MTSLARRFQRFVRRLRDDTEGVILPYVTLMMVVFIGLGALALDGGRYMSLQTQMQGAADSLALAGARELDQKTGARSRATNAINNLVSNGLSGLGYTNALAFSAPVFYSALPAATSGFTGTAATSDFDAKFVAVTVTPVQLQTVMPIAFFKAGGKNNFSAGAQAIAGYKGQAVCGVSPVFICNPYETTGMTDSQATAALYAALDPNDPSYNSATLHKLFRMDATNTSPGHFGWLQSTGNIAGCNPNSTPCINELVAYDDSSLSRSCFDGSGVQMATGNKPVSGSFNDRFDIYSGNGPSANFTPSINVRKGYIADTKGKTPWCSAGAGDYLAAQTGASGSTTVSLVPITALTTANKSSTVTVAGGTAGIVAGMTVTSGTAIPAGTFAKTITSSTVTLVDSSNKAVTVTLSSASTIFAWQTAPLPLDQNWTSVCGDGTCRQGDGQWDCGNYWKINHGAGVTYGGNGVCGTPAATTASRYDVYNYEINTSGGARIADWSGIPQGVPNAPLAENGAPLCSISKGYTPVYNATYDPRIVHVAVINCLAQTALGNIGGGNSGPPTPVAGFAKYFLTQPQNSDGRGYLYGEMTGLATSLDGVRIFNEVQLYR